MFIHFDTAVTRYDNEVNAADNPTYGVGLGTLVGRSQGVYSTCGPEEPCPLYEDLDKLGEWRKTVQFCFTSHTIIILTLLDGSYQY